MGPCPTCAMGLTLIEAAKYENRLEHLAVLRTFSEGELLARLPFMNIAGSGLFYAAEQELPSVGFRAVNEGYTQSYGVVDQRAEAVHLFGGDVDVDRSIVDLMGPEARASQIEMKVRSMRLTLESTVINGDSSANPRAIRSAGCGSPDGRAAVLPTPHHPAMSPRPAGPRSIPQPGAAGAQDLLGHGFEPLLCSLGWRINGLGFQCHGATGPMLPLLS